ncbi:uncharacterized protein LOC117331293 isoform X2 [Pecten maximus]|uniref:uncharacterized protein LOC117331293 isoform X2 n=1 Tax=Pecten maximus TaxID=6579 RepID=UPI0014584A2B|nr:uncharacterized protein LOC117331293 isoform X2 [Pecten maximus]
MDTMFVFYCFVILFVMEASCLRDDWICQNTTRDCASPSTPCQCKDYHRMATICYRVDISADLFIVDVSSNERADFIIRVYYDYYGDRTLVSRLKRKPVSCRLSNLPERNYTILVHTTTRNNKDECYCGGLMDRWCDACSIQVTNVSYSETWTASSRTQTPVSSSTLIVATVPERAPKQHKKESTTDTTEKSTFSSSHSGDPLPTVVQPSDESPYAPVVIAMSSCVVLVLVLILFIQQCKGKLHMCSHTKASQQTPSSKQEILLHPESPLTEKSVILSTKLSGKDSSEDVLDSGFQSKSACQCSILYNAYNGDDMDSVYDEKWGAFSIPKPVTYELGQNDKSENSQRKGSNPRKKDKVTGPVHAIPHSMPSNLYFSPPEDQSLALSEEMFRINGAYMKSIKVEPIQQLPTIRPDDMVRSCQVCQRNHAKERFPDPGHAPPSTFDILSLGGKSV